MKNILIIGASGDIGKAVTARLAGEDYQFILHYHQHYQAIDKLRNILDQNQILLEIGADLSTNQGIEQLLDKLVFPVDDIIFASGNAHFGLFQDITVSDMEAMLTLHVKMPWMVTRQLLPEMIRKKQGNIVLITSIWGDVGASNEVAYSSVKGAQNSFVKALAKETAISGVSVNGVSPGFIETKMNGHLSEQEYAAIIDQIPMNRAGTPDEVAHVVHFLMESQSKYIQGEIISVDGAW